MSVCKYCSPRLGNNAFILFRYVCREELPEMLNVLDRSLRSWVTRQLDTLKATQDRPVTPSTPRFGEYVECDDSPQVIRTPGMSWS